MNCEEYPLLKLVRGELSSARTERTLRHLELCRDCRERIRIMAMLDLEGGPRNSSGWGKIRIREGWRRPLAAMAAAILLACAVVYQSWKPDPVDVRSLAIREAYPLVRLESRDGPAEAACGEAFFLYGEARFAEAAAGFKACLPSPEVYFFEGVAEYLSGNPEAAARLLTKVIDLDSPWQEPSRWYAAQAYLLSGDWVTAKSILNRIADGQGNYSQSARDLLGRLEGVR